MKTATVLGLAALIAAPLAGCAFSSDDALASHESWSPPPTSPPAVTADRREDGDKYAGVGTNPFVVAAHDPLSTFAADVDTASYDIFRRDVEADMLPHQDSVRLEEYVNYFPYAYRPPAEDAAHPFSITMRAAPNPLQRTTLLAVGIKGKEIPWEKRPANLVFLIDVSGSMSASNKLPLIKRMLSESLEVLSPEDTLSIVTYAGNTSVRLRPTAISDREEVLRAIDGLSSGGSTAGAAGLDLAYEQAAQGFIEGGINHVLLCTDGDFNVGPSSTDALVDLIEQKRKTGITLTVLGFGAGNLNDAMMEAITNAGNGIYGVISSEDQAVDYVHDRMLSTFNLIARDVKIQLELNPARVHAYRLLGYENRALADEQFTDDTVDAGEVGSGHTVTALYELVLAGDPIPSPEGAPPPLDGPVSDNAPELGADDLCQVRIRYKAPDANAQDAAAQLTQGLPAAQAATGLQRAAPDFRWAAGIAALAEVLKQSPYAQPDKLDVIGGLLEGSAGTDADRLELLTLFERARQLLAAPR